jgi:dipeptidyl aminopeptidase/acylaminoacyl peptidase
VAGCVAILLIGGTAVAADEAPRREPVPLDVALSLRGHDNRSSFTFSPDAQWVAHTVETDDTLPRGSQWFSPTGAPFAEGRSRMEAHLTNAHTGAEISLGGPASSSWAPTWSPDGKRVAFYSDEGGSAGLWIWDLATGRPVRFPGVVVRPFFGFEVPRWSADGQTLLCKILPEGMTIALANGLNPVSDTKRRFPAHDAKAPGVLVLRSGGDKAVSAGDDTSAVTNHSLADLALLDPRSDQVQRIARAVKVRWYAFSPDQRSVAYSQIDGTVPNSRQPLFRLDLLDRSSGRQRTLARGVALAYGVELAWSPDSRSLALIDDDAHGGGRLSILPIDGSPLRRLPIPQAKLREEQTPPRWSADGRFLYAIAAGGKLWQIDVRSGRSKAITTPSGIEVTALVSKFDRPTAWTTNHGRTLWAFGLRRDDDQPSLLRIDASTGEAEAAPLPDREIERFPNIDANDISGEIAFVARDQQHTADLWIYDTKGAAALQISHLNPDLERYALGAAKLISFHATDGNPLRASLLLPPGYQPGRSLPTVVWVYGGANGSDAVRTFGLWGEAPIFDMQVLATRGYAILFPDIPLNEGTPVKDILNTVMPAVDAAIAQGYADPNRLAVMGQSYGAYSVLALITHTIRFKAAVVTGNVLHPDLLASYLEMEPDGSDKWVGYLEHGQGDMGGSPWQFHDRYLENSPIYSFDRITTPVLMGQGSDDDTLFGADATFVALRRLGKQVEYRLYDGEGHALERKQNVRDFWERRLDFLAEHLGLNN